MARLTLEDLFPAPKEATYEDGLKKLHLWHNETIGNIEFHACKVCSKVEMTMNYQVHEDYYSRDECNRFILKKAINGFPCSRT